MNHIHFMTPYQLLVVQRVDVLVDGVAGELDLGQPEVHRGSLGNVPDEEEWILTPIETHD